MIQPAYSPASSSFSTSSSWPMFLPAGWNGDFFAGRHRPRRGRVISDLYSCNRSEHAFDQGPDPSADPRSDIVAASDTGIRATDRTHRARFCLAELPSAVGGARAEHLHSPGIDRD